MSHKTIAKIAIFMLVVFGATILLYPLMFNPDERTKTPIEAPPIPSAALPVRK